MHWWEQNTGRPLRLPGAPWWATPHASQADTASAKEWREGYLRASAFRELQPRLLASALLPPNAESISALMPQLLHTDKLTWPELCDWHSKQDWRLEAPHAIAGEPTSLAFRLRLLNYCSFALAAAVQEAVQGSNDASPTVQAANANTAASMAADVLASLSRSLQASATDATACQQLLPGAASCALNVLACHELQPLAALLSVWSEACSGVASRDGVAGIAGACAQLAEQVELVAATLRANVPAHVPAALEDAGLSVFGEEGQARLRQVGDAKPLARLLRGVLEQQGKALKQTAAAFDGCIAVVRAARTRLPAPGRAKAENAAVER